MGQAGIGSSLTDYRVYLLSSGEKWVCRLAGGIFLFSVGYLFFHHWIPAGLLSGAGWVFPGYWRQYLLKRRRDTLGIQFKQALYSLSSSLAAGRSVENGFREAIEDLRLLSPDHDNDLIKELSVIVARMEYGQPVEEALQDFARRADLEDITNFADVFATCKRTGGDLVEVVRRTSSIIGEKLEIQQEIRVMVSQKRFEARAMFAAPILFVVFMNLTAKDYMEPLYSGIGYLISFLSLLTLGSCLLWINKIMKIDV
ncbi:type II secretion system F family protein [Paenibacillus sp. JX-17]|uniref:Type II secretion system F family protein n=1 Tax=Paenibacillus lacisoli TaxID=3064525 RepID=A0ABT9CDE3_9BACL|nr:type II secretion system F family protein [Paenibacillus sp. JX-17]MDO7907294.1 type II secretion system F family protein [Paenibacillus sp. JX-17]